MDRRRYVCGKRVVLGLLCRTQTTFCEGQFEKRRKTSEDTLSPGAAYLAAASRQKRFFSVLAPFNNGIRSLLDTKKLNCLKRRQELRVVASRTCLTKIRLEARGCLGLKRMSGPEILTRYFCVTRLLSW